MKTYIGVKIVLIVLVLVSMVGCNSTTRSINILVEEGGIFNIDKFESLVDLKKGDEILTATPDISPTLSVPL